MILNKYLNFLEKIKNRVMSYIKSNYSMNTINLFQVITYGVIGIISIYFVLVAFTEIILVFILFMLVLIYRKL